MSNAFGYPFALLRRRPMSAALGFLFLVLVLMILDLGFAAGGQDVLSQQAANTSNRLYVLMSSIITTFASAMVMAVVLIDQKRRDADTRPSLTDGISQIVLTLKFGFGVLLPFGIAAFAIVVGGSYVNIIAAIVLGVALAFGFIYVGVRLYLAWPMAVADGEARLWRAWPLTRRKFWPLFGSLLLIYAVALGPVLAVSVSFMSAGLASDTPVVTLSDALLPQTLFTTAAQEIVTAFSVFYSAAAAAFLYCVIDPSQTAIADEF